MIHCCTVDMQLQVLYTCTGIHTYKYPHMLCFGVSTLCTNLQTLACTREQSLPCLHVYTCSCVHVYMCIQFCKVYIAHSLPASLCRLIFDERRTRPGYVVGTVSYAFLCCAGRTVVHRVHPLARNARSRWADEGMHPPIPKHAPHDRSWRGERECVWK